MVINLHKPDCIDDEILRHTIGIIHKKYLLKTWRNNGQTLHWNKSAYAYPLSETHKLNKSVVLNTNIFEKPTRLNISRELVKISLSNAIEKWTNYSKQLNKTLVDLTMFCLENVVVKNGTSFYLQV